jgi:hypothetical protein
MKISRLLVVSVALASCHHVYYAPNTPNAPMLVEKGDTRINGLYTSGRDSDYEGGEVQFAHAVSDKIGIMAAGFFAGVTENTGSRNEKGTGSYGEIGVGRFTAFDPKKRWIGELYGGLGFGGVKNDYGLGDHSKVNIFKPFIQPLIGYKSRYFECAFIPRISWINWKVKENAVNSDDNLGAKGDLATISGNSGFVAFEPSIMLRGGGANVKIQGGLSFSRYHSTNTLYSAELVETLNASLGISFTFNTRSTQ